MAHWHSPKRWPRASARTEEGACSSGDRAHQDFVLSLIETLLSPIHLQNLLTLTQQVSTLPGPKRASTQSQMLGSTDAGSLCHCLLG